MVIQPDGAETARSSHHGYTQKHLDSATTLASIVTTKVDEVEGSSGETFGAHMNAGITKRYVNLFLLLLLHEFAIGFTVENNNFPKYSLESGPRGFMDDLLG